MDQEKANRRAEVIMQVRSGAISARQGARLLGVSRKTYYQWERKGLSALLQALEDGESGRPVLPRQDLETEALRLKVASLEQQLQTAKQSETVRRVLELYEQQCRLQSGKKKERPGK